MRKKIVTLGVLLAMLCGISENVAATTYTKEKEVPPSTYQNDNLDIDLVRYEVNPRMRTSTLAESYMSPYITSVKNQEPYGTCWAFAFIGASEASMMKEGVVEKNTVDMSELHLAYFLSHSVTDPLGGTEGDKFSITDTSVNAFLSVGGNQETATCRVANWYGLVNESTVPYDSIVNGERVVLSDEIAYDADVAHLENAYWISMEDRDTVKRLIMEYGACATAYCSENQYYSTGTSGAYDMQDAVAVYCPKELETDHGIMIVGWDDTYSKENFGTYKPSADGAWYCKNSWGNDWSKDGYFWLSYEDVPSSKGEAFFYDYGSVDNYDKNYQYDGGAANAKYECNSAANIYIAQEDEYIKAVGFYTYDSNYDCKVDVYKNCTAGNPTNGTLIATMEANQLYAGFHTVELENSCLVQEGESFSVVVYQKATDGEQTYVLADYNYTVAGKWCSNTSVSKAGQSFIANESGHWKDLYSDQANCRIKAYTDTRIPVTEVSLDASELILYADETAKLSAVVTPANATKKSVTWSSSDEDVVSVDGYGNIIGKKAGVADIICTSDDDKEVQSICKVTVKQWVQSVNVNYIDYELAAGDSVQLSVTVSPKDATDQSIAWMSSDEEVATVSEAGIVTAVGYGTATITCTAADQNLYTDTCEILVYEKMNEIVLDTSQATLKMGETLRLTATTSPELSYTKGVYWTTSNAGVVSVNQDGLVTVLSEQSATVEIRCVAKDGTGVKAVCVVEVNKQKDAEDQDDNQSTEEDQESNQDPGSGKDVAGVQYKIQTDSNNRTVVELVSGANYSGKVEIPPIVNIDGVTYKVTSISDNAFKNNKRITKVIIGDNITSIGKNAFSGCNNLTTVSIGNNVRTIGNKAFYNCKKLKTLEIGKNVKIIGDKAFYQCIKLKKVEIPSKVSKIGRQAFYGCKKLKSITIKTKKLTNKNVGKKAFKGISTKATIQVPKKKVKAYKTLLKAKGIGNKVKVKNY